MLSSCPGCGRSVRPELSRCLCGHDLTRAGKPAKRAAASLPRLLVLLVVGVVGGLAVTWGVYRFKYQHRIETLRDPQANARPGEEWVQDTDVSVVPDFDVSLKIGTDPQGLAWNGTSFLAGNRSDPWGFVRLTPDAGHESFTLQKLPVVETRYAQRMGFDAVTWNGVAWVALTEGGWFQESGKDFFVVLDGPVPPFPRSLHALRPGAPAKGFHGQDGGASLLCELQDRGPEAQLVELDERDGKHHRIEAERLQGLQRGFCRMGREPDVPHFPLFFGLQDHLHGPAGCQGLLHFVRIPQAMELVEIEVIGLETF